MNFSDKAIAIFRKAIDDYHIRDHVDTLLKNDYHDKIDRILYHKCWIDTVQWHLEDIIRDPEIAPDDALKIKRRIDSSNQERTDMVEHIDTYFSETIGAKNLGKGRINTETPAWAIDRLSILCLKIYHMRQEVLRTDVDEAHRLKCESKLGILEEQLKDLREGIDQLLHDIEIGDVQMKLYRQMKMYNDPSLNPVLYKSNK